MSGRGTGGARVATAADLARLARALDALERHVRPYGDGRQPISLAGWERLVDRRLARQRQGAQQ